MRFAVDAGIQQQQVEPADFDALIERPGWRRVGRGWKRGAHQLAGIVIAGNAGEGQLQRRQQALQMLIFLRHRRIGQIAGDHHEVGPWPERVQRRHASHQRGCRVDAAVSQRSRRLDVQVGNLRDQDWLLRHQRSQFSGGNSLTASGAIESPTRSPALARTVFGASTVSNFADAPETMMRCRSPMKLTLSIIPASGAPSASTMRMVSGRIMAMAAGTLASPPTGCRPPGSTRWPASSGASMILAAPMNSATKRFFDAK